MFSLSVTLRSSIRDWKPSVAEGPSAATAPAMSFARATKSSDLAEKSVSDLS